MLVLPLILATLAHAGRFDGADPNVIVERVVPAEPAALVGPLSSVEILAQLFPADCLDDWEHGTTTSGVGAVSRVTYRMGPLRRRLTMQVTKAEPHVVVLDHPGKKGFTTQFRLEPVDGGTKVTLGTWLTPPPWPFVPVYYNQVRPDWQGCWSRTLDHLSAFSASASGMAP